MPAMKYDKALRDTPEFQVLYGKWRRVLEKERCADWATFLDFYKWSLEDGFVLGDRLVCIDKSKPYGPDNCVWIGPNTPENAYSEKDQEWILLWNETVNRIRRLCRMKPL